MSFLKKAANKVNSAVKTVTKSEKNDDEATRQINEYIKELEKFEKKIKEIEKKFEKAGDDGKKQFDDIRKTLEYCSDLTNNKEDNPYKRCNEMIEEVKEKAEKYQEKMSKKAMKPLKQYKEYIESLSKRVKILQDREKALKKAKDNYKDMKKKEEKKQIGLKDLLVNYQNCQDSWEYLRDELVVDLKSVLEVVKKNFGQICAIFMKQYGKFMKSLNEIWEKIIDYCKNLKVGDLEEEVSFTPIEKSMVSETNINAEREKRKAKGDYNEVD